jgi:hypothetical protein
MKTALALTLIFGLTILSKGQTNPNQVTTPPVWTEADRKYLLDNFVRTKQRLLDETTCQRNNGTLRKALIGGVSIKLLSILIVTN